MKVLITGATGMLGKAMIQYCTSQNIAYHCLSSKPKEGSFLWDINKGFIDEKCLEGVTHIVHFAGENVASKRWTADRKKMILESRLKTSELLFNALKNTKNQVESILCMSAIGYYGDRGNELVDENSQSGTGFLAETCISWEESSKRFQEIVKEVYIMRLGVVLDKNEGAFPEIYFPLKLRTMPQLGGGNQWLSWIHKDDVINLLGKCIQNQIPADTYNVISNQHTWRDFLKEANQHLQQWSISIPVPTFALKLILGEKASIVVDSTKVSNEKLKKANFQFQYTAISDVMKSFGY